MTPRHTTDQIRFTVSGNTIYALSVSRKDVRYVINPAERTCECPSFTYRKTDDFLCVHLRALVEKFPAQFAA